MITKDSYVVLGYSVQFIVGIFYNEDTEFQKAT